MKADAAEEARVGEAEADLGASEEEEAAVWEMAEMVGVEVSACPSNERPRLLHACNP